MGDLLLCVGDSRVRSDEPFSSRLPNVEPLRLECEHFVECIRVGQTPRLGERRGLRVVQLQSSLDDDAARGTP